MKARLLFAALSLGPASLALSGCETPPESTPLLEADVIITGGTVFDGSGAAGERIDLVITGSSITYVGSNADEHYWAPSIVDATGLVVSPGFIDPHTHAEQDLASQDQSRRANLPYAHQGVTTVVVGNDGFGSPQIEEQATAARADGIGTNVAFLAGFGPIREAELQMENRAPDANELGAMHEQMRQAMCEGAWGLSAGLYYVPQNFAATDEVVALAEVAGAMGGYFDTHMRDESTYSVTVTGALEETLEIGRRASIPVHISHIKALGPAVWGESAPMIAAIEAARAEGMRVTADQYPWEASGTRISNALVPRWALEGGLDGLRTRLDDPAQAVTIRDGMLEGLERRGGAQRLLITGPLGDAEVDPGQTLAELAAALGIEPADAAIQILLEGDARVASFNMSAEDIAAFAQQPWVVTGSDGSTGHPRKYASFPKAYRDLVTESETMPLGQFIRRSSGLTADIIGLADRGYLRPGYAADVLLFDPRTYAPLADYQSPTELAAGVVHLFVNGEQMISDGAYTGALPGLPLLKETSC